MARPKRVGRGIGYRRLDWVKRDTAGPYISPDAATGKAVWTLADILRLIAFLDGKAQGDGNKFKKPVLREAAEHMNQHILVGGCKKWTSVRDKLVELFAIFKAVEYLKGLSGVSWDDILGCDVQTEHELSVWNGIVAEHPDCAPFKNAGWEVFDDMVCLHPEKAKGTHAYHPSLGTQGAANETEPASQSGDASPRETPPPRQSRSPSPASPSSTHSSPSPPPARSLSSEFWGDSSTQRTSQSSSQAASSQAPASSARGASSAARHATPSTPAPASRKRAAAAPAGVPRSAKLARVALNESIDRFNATFAETANKFTEALKPTHDASPVRRRRAMDVAKAKEKSWLTPLQRINLGKILEVTTSADTYLAWDEDSEALRKLWVGTALNIPVPDVDENLL